MITKVTFFRGDLSNTSAETEAPAHTPPNDDVLEVVVCLTCYQLCSLHLAMAIGDNHRLKASVLQEAEQLRDFWFKLKAPHALLVKHILQKPGCF